MRLIGVAMKLVPERWRETVARDLREEATRRGKGKLWQVRHAVCVGLALRVRRAGTQQPSIAEGLPWRSGNLARDVFLALRTIRAHPWSTAAIVTTLAFGIGGSTAVYAVFNYALLRPIPGIADEASLVSVYVRPDLREQAYTTASHEHLVAMREMPAFAGLAGYRTTAYPVQLADRDPQTLRVTSVSLGYFDLLGVRATAGRFFGAEEYERPGAALAVISERLWRSSLGADPAAIGAPMRIAGNPFTVVGVARSFRGLERVGDEDVWVPIGANAVIRPARSEYRWDRMVGRLRPEATLVQARQQAAAAFERVGVIGGGDRNVYSAVVYPGLSDGFDVTEDSMTVAFRLAMAGSALLLLLACANAAGMLFALHLRRRGDLALKAALGASPARVVRELLVEAAGIGLLAAAGGLLGASILTGLFRQLRFAGYMPPLEDLTLDWRVGLFATATAAATVLLAAVLPALAAVRADPRSGLQDLARGASRSGRLRQALTAVQVALSLALAASAGVLGQSVARLHALDLGFEPGRLLTVGYRPGLTYGLQPGLVGRDDAPSFFREVEQRLAAAPGIEAVGFASSPHLGSFLRAELLSSPDDPAVPGTVRYVSRDYFRAMGIPLLAGRSFTVAEARTEGTAGPAVVDELVAERLFGDASAVGRSVHVRIGSRPLEAREIIGVVGPTAHNVSNDGIRPTVYVPPGDLRAAVFQVRTALPPAEAMTTIRRVVREVEPLLAVDAIETAETQIERFTAEERVLARLGVVLAVLALALAVAGVYATLAGAVQERTRELGIRMALGASSAAVGRDVLRRAGLIAAVGFVGGLSLYAWASRYLESHLFGISALDPLTLAAACALLLASALAASWLPARRATRVDPSIALRAE